MQYCVRNWATQCSNLPRSLLPVALFDQTNVIAPDTTKVLDMYSCLINCGGPDCIRIWPLYFGPAFDPNWCSTWSGSSQQLQLIQAAMTAGGSCTNTNPGGWRDDVMQSNVEAINQVEKFRKRLEFLTGFPPGGGEDSLVKRAKEAWSELKRAHDELSAFLIGDDTNPSPAEKLTNLMRDFGTKPPPLPSQAVYVWQSDPDPKRPFDAHGNPMKGSWHIVRVDVRIPQRCGTNASCGPGGNFPDSVWPWISTRTISWGTRRCYALESWRGSVKARVTRFDEDKAPGFLTFPSGEKIWDFRFSNPLAPRASNVNSDISRDCLPGGGSGSTCDLELSSAPNAFLIGSRNDCKNPPCNNQCAACWRTVNEILQSGVTTETCAEYFLIERGHAGTHFHSKFIKCRNFD